jgi:hypothetical protein
MAFDRIDECRAILIDTTLQAGYPPHIPIVKHSTGSQWTGAQVS